MGKTGKRMQPELRCSEGEFCEVKNQTTEKGNRKRLTLEKLPVTIHYISYQTSKEVEP